MCRYMLGFIGFAALGASPLGAQTPANVQTITHREAVVECEGGSCSRTVCVPECYTKTIKKAVYKSGCEPLCVTFYPPFGGLLGRGNCNTGDCRQPITRRYLMKKTISSEISGVKCVPSSAGNCVTAPPFATLPATSPGPATYGVGTVGFTGELRMPQAPALPK